MFDVNYSITILPLWALIPAPSAEDVFFSDIDKSYR